MKTLPASVQTELNYFQLFNYFDNLFLPIVNGMELISEIKLLPSDQKNRIDIN